MGGGSPMIRGFATNRVMIVVDGVRINNAIFRSGNLQNVISIDALSVQNAEVIFGPGSILYGSDAIGGVMDFHTLQPVFSKNKKTLVKLNSFTRFSSANNEGTLHADVNIASQKLSFLGSVTHSHFHDLRMGKKGGYNSYLRPTYVERANNTDSVFSNEDPHLQKQSGYKQWNALGKIRYKPMDHLNLQYAYHFSATGNVPRYDRLIEFSNQLPSFAEWYYGPQTWKMHHLQAEYTREHKVFSTAKLIASIQDYEESRNDRRLNNARVRNQTENVTIAAINLDLTKSFSEKHELFYGAEYIGNNVGSSAFRKDINTDVVEPTASRYPNGSTWNSFGLYSSYKYNINKYFTFSTGARYSHVKLFAPFDNTFFQFPFSEATLSKGALTGSAGLVYRPATTWKFNANFSTGFRVPNIDDVGKVFDSEPGNVIVPNPELKAEYAYNIDIGVAHAVTDKMLFDITAFYTILDDAIVRRPFLFSGEDSILYEGIPSRVQALQNVAMAKVWGIQAGLEYYFTKKISTVIRANYIDGNETDDEQNQQVKLRHAPPFYGSAAIRFTSDVISAEFNTIFNGQISANDLAPSERSKPFIYAQDETGRPFSPAWYTLNFKASYKASPHLQIGIGLENILNQLHRPYSSGIVAPGRNFILSVRAGL